MEKILICGGLIIDKYVLVDEYPERGGDGYITGGFDVVGGCAVNIASTVKNLGAMPYVVSAIGNDFAGDEIMNFMKKEQLSVDCVKRAEGSTGYCLVFLEPDGERTFLTYKGCEAGYSDSLISNETTDSCRVVAVTGYYLLDGSSQKLIERLKILKDKGCSVIFDPSPLVDKIDESYLKEILLISDVVTPNESEVKTLAGAETPEQWALSCCEKGLSVIIKKGADGGVLYQKGEKIPYDAIGVRTVDTTGAGDSFTGAIAYALANGIPLEKGILLAASTAAVTATIKGPNGNFEINDLTSEAQDIWKEYHRSVG